MKRYRARIMQERAAEFVAKDIKDAEAIVRRTIHPSDRILEIVEIPISPPEEEPSNVG